jgi:Major Facilitator Superfamily
MIFLASPAKTVNSESHCRGVRPYAPTQPQTGITFGNNQNGFLCLVSPNRIRELIANGLFLQKPYDFHSHHKEPMMNQKSQATVYMGSALLTLILGGLQTVMPLSTDLYLPALPTIARDLKVSPGAAQFTVAVFMIGVALGQITYGPITDKYGRKKPLLFGLSVYILG